MPLESVAWYSEMEVNNSSSPNWRLDKGEQTANSNARLSTAQAHYTPPESPVRSAQRQSSYAENGFFQNYLRAFCHFEPPTEAEANDEALLMTVRIQPGDLILIHSVHANGWADGTVLTTNERGWLPTNYCETFDHPYMRNLLSAMTHFWDLLGASNDENLSTFVRQDYVRPLIAGVRFLLEHADCLHRDAPLVQRSTGLRRLRKGLLADLSSVVQIAKRLQEVVAEPLVGDAVQHLLDELMVKACKAVTRAVGFVDMLQQEGVGVVPLKQSSRKSVRVAVDTSAREAQHGKAHDGSELPDPIDSGKCFTEPAEPKQISEEDQAAAGDHVRSNSQKRLSRGPGSLISHRLSTVRYDAVHSDGLATERLAQAHDVCISQIAGFIGLYLHSSNPASELAAMTRRLQSTCDTMLDVLDRIAAVEPLGSCSIRKARRMFQWKLNDLTVETDKLFANAVRLDEDIVMEPSHRDHLVELSTSLIRAAGDCVVKVRRIVEQIGDFDLENPPSTRQAIPHDEDAVTGANNTEGQSHSSDPRPATSSTDSQSRSTQNASPTTRQRAKTTTAVHDLTRESSAKTSSRTPDKSISLTIPSYTPMESKADAAAPQLSPPNADTTKSARSSRTHSTSPVRKFSVGASISTSTDTRLSSMRDSGITAVSEISTRATTPDHAKDAPALVNSVDSFSSIPSTGNVESSIDAEAQLLQKTYANELTLNKDGQVTGGSLPALIEQLTTGDTAPDPQFVAAFFVTFRSFTTARELAQALIQRFDYIGEDKAVGVPVRLRIYNVFKGWLDTYWKVDGDREALGDIRYFALHKLKPLMPLAGERLLESIRKISASSQNGSASATFAPGPRKYNALSVSQEEIDCDAPEPMITRSQLNTLKKCVADSTASCSVMDFDPLEMARQLTVLGSRMFCEIQADEFLSLEWNKKDSLKAENVRNMCLLNTDVAHFVGDTILTPEDAKKRALVIKYWSKVATRCLELNNYESLMAIMCSLNSSVVQRLKRTWELVSKKSRARLDELNTVVDFSRNQMSLRRRLENAPTPCLPFLGVYLTDLIMLDAGNAKLRQLPGVRTSTGEALTVINFDKHMRMARIVAHLQHFQTPYKLQEVRDMQAWLHMHLDRMRSCNAQMVGDFHRRSLYIEPKRDAASATHAMLALPKLPEFRRATDPTASRAGAGSRDGSGGEEQQQQQSQSQQLVRPKTAGYAPTSKSFKSGGQAFEFLWKTRFDFKGRGEGVVEGT
ncbi:ras guanine nucleotide exchange factor domain-containing protein [Neohortaea acidophila]|uniref:Ras guanine nucleotide exchange factor domain-containing protein n=1 Tax=Neohortaea acidophila TaxID=245834 RepID=A0A6A6PKF7_9PEZI|nr:ras guanine nucleotide exchange factor domain-containing protein [Neohortaea acidophila]KAF2479983.1 ras guanine nucleotide exchange factor domain-containing protein [Neohortaea acidophila]